MNIVREERFLIQLYTGQEEQFVFRPVFYTVEELSEFVEAVNSGREEAPVSFQRIKDEMVSSCQVEVDTPACMVFQITNE